MELDINLYSIIQLLSGVTLLIVGLCLLGISIPRGDTLRNYRISRRLLSLAFFMLGAVSIWEVWAGFEPDSGFDPVILVLTLSTAALQAFLFTSALINLINIRFMTTRWMLSQFGLIAGLSAVLLIIYAYVKPEITWPLFWVFTGFYCLQLLYYIRLFIREHRKYQHNIDNYFSEDEQNRLAWVKHFFILAAGIGVSAIVSLFLPTVPYILFILTYTVLYVYFSVKYINYALIFKHIEPTLNLSAPTPVPQGSWQEQLSGSLEAWVLSRGYISPNITLGTLARQLATNQTYLSRYINTTKGLTFKQWIGALRIAEAQKLLAGNPEIAIDDIYRRVGISSRSSFFRQFTDVTGMAPGEYRDRFGSGRTEPT